MTREKAIKTLYEYRHCLWDKLYEPICMAIKALEQNESAEEWYKLFVEKLEQESKTGHWYYDEKREATGIYAICSNCDEKIYQTGDFKYCPNCGAKMENEG